MNALVLVVTGLLLFALAYRYYSAFLTAKVLVTAETLETPAHSLKDGVDYHPTNRWVLFGHHFAAIAGAGPLIGPVLAAQFGVLPGALWILIGACLAGGVHDFVILFASVRGKGLSLANIARSHISRLSGVITSAAILFIITAALAGLAIAVVNALAINPDVPGDIGSPWGTFAILVSIPAALLVGLYMYHIRPGKIAEASALGVVLVTLGVVLGHPFQESGSGHLLSFQPATLKVALPVYGFVASVLPVWLLLCPRDYLSSYMKVGVVVLLAIGIFVVHPQLRMPAFTEFVHGGGPVVPGKVWPFVSITIMCGAISGFHSLVASGTTPKMINSEKDLRMIGYGAMLLEGFVALMAVIAATVLAPNDYFAINANPVKFPQYSQVALQPGPGGQPSELVRLTREVGETNLVGRTGGAVTLAVGMASIFSGLPGMRGLMSYWYHFAIMFEALFILTTVDTGTRVARFILQEAMEAAWRRKLRKAGKWVMNILASALVCFAWGYLLYNNDIRTIWPMFGIANQLLAAIALAIGTTIILQTSANRVCALTTFLPFLYVLITTVVGGLQSLPGLSKVAPGDPPYKGPLNVGLTVTMLILTFVIALDAMVRWVGLLRARRAAGFSGRAVPSPSTEA